MQDISFIVVITFYNLLSKYHVFIKCDIFKSSLVLTYLITTILPICKQKLLVLGIMFVVP